MIASVKRSGVQSGPALENLIGLFMGRNEIESLVLDDGAVVKEALGYERQHFGFGESRVGEEDPKGSGSLRDEDEAISVGVIKELGVEIDGLGVSEAAFGAELRLELKGEYVEAIIVPAHGGEEDGAIGFH